MLTRMAPLLTRMARMLTRMTRWLADSHIIHTRNYSINLLGTIHRARENELQPILKYLMENHIFPSVLL